MARAGSWLRWFSGGDSGSRGSFVSTCLASRKTSEILGLREGKKKVREGQEDGKERELAWQGGELK